MVFIGGYCGVSDIGYVCTHHVLVMLKGMDVKLCTSSQGYVDSALSVCSCFFSSCLCLRLLATMDWIYVFFCSLSAYRVDCTGALGWVICTDGSVKVTSHCYAECNHAL